jgi:hypothetical protein
MNWMGFCIVLVWTQLSKIENTPAVHEGWPVDEGRRRTCIRSHTPKTLEDSYFEEVFEL